MAAAGKEGKRARKRAQSAVEAKPQPVIILALTARPRVAWRPALTVYQLRGQWQQTCA